MHRAKTDNAEIEGDEKGETTAVTSNAGLLDAFWALADMNETIREDAVVQLITELRDKQSTGEDEVRQSIEYTLKRLVRGLSSPHKAARLGFYVALVHLLREFTSIELGYCLALIKQHLRGKPSSKYDKVNTDETNACCQASVGLCLGYGAIVRSRRLVQDFDVMKQLLSELLTHCTQSEAFRELSATLLVELINDMDESDFKSVLWPLFRNYFQKGWDDCTCEKLWLAIVCSQKFTHTVKKNYLKEVWGGKSSLIHCDYHDAIAKIFMRSSSSHPRVHPICKTVLRALYSSPENFYTFWKIVTDMAFGKQQRKEKSYLTFELLKEILLDDGFVVTVQGVRQLLLPCFTLSLLQSLAHPQVVLHGAAVQLADVLVSFVSKMNDADTQLEVVKSLLLPPGSFSFDQVTHSSTISSMIAHLKIDAVRQLIDLLKDAFLDEANAAIEGQRLSALHMLSRMISLSTFVKNSVEMQLDILRFFTLHAFFDQKTLSLNIPECNRRITKVSTALHDKARNCFFACIAALSARGPSNVTVGTATSIPRRRSIQLDVLFALFVHVDELLRNPQVASPLLDETKKSQVVESVAEALRVVKKLRRSMTDEVDAESHAFQLLLIHLGVHLFVDSTLATTEALKDVHVCYEKLSNRRGDNVEVIDEPAWILVLVDLLLSLLASASEVGRMRNVVHDVFVLLVDPHLTVDALDHILDVVDPKRGVDDEDDDDDGFNEDESGLNGNVDENSSMDEDDDDDDDDDDEENTIGCNGTLRDAVKAALGSAADDSDRDENDSDEVVLDDEAMMQLDDTLAEAFRSAAVRRPSRPSKEDEECVHFRHRCFDLIGTVISSRPSVPFFLRLILPLVSTVESALKDKVRLSVGQKALTCLRRLCRVKQLRDEISEAGTNNLATILRELVGKFRKVSDYETSLVIAEACTFVVRCALRADQHKESSQNENEKGKRKSKPKSKSSSHTDECVEIYRQTLRDYFDNKEPHTPHQMFTCLVKKYLLLGWQLADVLQSYAFRPEVRLFKRTRAVTMLCSLMSNPNLVLQVVGAEHWSTVSDDILPKIAENLESLLVNVKPRSVAEMLHLTVNIATLDRKYNRLLSTDSWNSISDAIQRLSLIDELPKDARKQIKRFRTLISHQQNDAGGKRSAVKRSKEREDVELTPIKRRKKVKNNFKK